MMPRRHVLAAAFLPALAPILLTALAGCTGPGRSGLAGGKVEPAQEIQEAVVVLVDTTTAAGGGERVREQIRAEFRQVTETLGPGVRLLVLGVGANSAVQPVVWAGSFDQGAGGWLFGENAYTREKRLHGLRGEAVAAVEGLLAEPPAGRTGTTIIDALAQAARLTQPHPRRTLVLISDMVEQSDLADLTAALPEPAEPLLANLDQSGRLPDLAGACIYVTGVNAGPDGWMDPARVHGVRRFWEAFFARTGARLLAYGPSLVDYRGCPGEPGKPGKPGE